MPYPPDYRATLGLRPEVNDHEESDNYGAFGNSEALSDASIDGGLTQQFQQLSDAISGNAAAYQQRRTQIGLSPTQLRVISDVGIADLQELGRRPRGTGAPIFRYLAPKTTESIRPFRDGIRWVVMHSFGRGFDRRALRDGARTVSIDPLTGHNPRRFAIGLNTLINPNAGTSAGGFSSTTTSTGERAAGAAIHHLVSLRGDIVNSVSWDTRCVHGEGGGYRLGINDKSIGIEHEEWYAAPVHPASRDRFREIQDHGPYSEETYACDAFILKKLQAYTGQSFTQFLGADEGCRQNISNNVIGCFNHASTSGHADPGAEYFLPPEYELRVTRFTSLTQTPNVVSRAGAWDERMGIWFSDVPTGTRISAYARIFDKVARLRSFNLQTEVFDPTTGGGIIQVVPPTPGGAYTSGLAETVGRDRLSGADRAARLSSSSRVEHYAAATSAASSVVTALDRASSRLAAIAGQTVRVPVVVNATAFNFSTGLWENQTTTAAIPTVNADTDTAPAPTADIDPTTVP